MMSLKAQTNNNLQHGEYKQIRYIGDSDIMNNSKFAFFCSVKAPGDIVLKTFEHAKKLREENVTVISGFHSPMEQECLRILLKGTQPIIVCPARNIDSMRIPAAWETHIEQGRMLILSPFDERYKRTTSQTSQLRNQFIADIADCIFIAYAAPDSKTLSLCKRIIGNGKKVCTIDSHDNKNLITAGATFTSR